MEIKLFNQIHTQLYEEILKGKYKPSLAKYNDSDNLKALFSEAQTIRITFSEDISRKYKEEAPDMMQYGFKNSQHFTFTVKNNRKNGTWELTIVPVKQYKLKEKINIPIYPSEKAIEYCRLICDEFERIKVRAEFVHEKVESREQLNLYATKNITKAKKLHHDAQILISNLQQEKNTECVFIIFVLDLFLIQTILLFQKMFKSYLNGPLESEYELKTELFTLAFSGHAGFVTGLWDEKKSVSQHQQISEVQSGSHSATSVKKSAHDFTGDTESYTENQHRYTANGNNTGTVGENVAVYRTKKGRTFYAPPVGKRKYQINGQLNVICDVMEQMVGHTLKSGKPFLSMSRDQILCFIADNFLDKDNYDISIDSLETYLNPSRKDKKIHPDSPKRINLSDVLKENEESPED